MKKIIFLTVMAIACRQTHAQLKTTVTCPTITVDILDGKVNGMEPDFTQAQIKKALPCVTREEPETKDSKCGGGLFYKDKDIHFYTGRDYVEIGPAFKGRLSIPLMGATRNGLFKWLGNAAIKDKNWDAYTTAYGVLILYFNKANRINKIQFSSQTAATIQLCE